MSHPDSTGNCKAGGDDGFSLMEMLVAVVIMALVLALLPDAFRLAQRTWEAAVKLDGAATRDGGSSFLQDRLAEAMPLFEPHRSGTVKLAFTGTSDHLSFVAPLRNGPMGGGLYRFILETKVPDTDPRIALVVAISPYATDPAESSEAPAAEQHILFTDVLGVGFRYYGRASSRDAASWQTEWTRMDTLPDLVELNIRAGRGSATRTQAIVVELRLRNAP